MSEWKTMLREFGKFCLLFVVAVGAFFITIMTAAKLFAFILEITGNTASK